MPRSFGRMVLAWWTVRLERQHHYWHPGSKLGRGLRGFSGNGRIVPGEQNSPRAAKKHSFLLLQRKNRGAWKNPQNQLNPRNPRPNFEPGWQPYASVHEPDLTSRR